MLNNESDVILMVKTVLEENKFQVDSFGVGYFYIKIDIN
jgi:hypothetical protein